jgi:peptide/nickel transport system permease protein
VTTPSTDSRQDGKGRGGTSRPSWLVRLLRKPPALLGFILTVATVLAAILAPWLTPYDPTTLNVMERLQGPSAQHWLGTDELGRDILTRLLYGARISLQVGAISMVIALAVGVPLGLLSAYFGGAVDTVVMRSMDALAAFPAILLALAIVAALGPGVTNAMIAIGVVYLPAFSRLARGSALAVQENDFVTAARAVGARDAYTMFRVVLPNAVAPIIVHASLGFANAIIVEAALSFLGLGAQPPDPSWGAMLNQSRQFMTQTVTYSIASGSAIFVSVLGLNLLGDGLRDVLDPRSLD